MGDFVYIKLQSYKQTSVAKGECHKLSAMYFGPYPIEEKIGRVAYRVRLPEGVKIHNVFHISQLKKKPVVNFDRQLVKRFNRVNVKVLVYWSHSSPEDAFWKFYDDL